MFSCVMLVQGELGSVGSSIAAKLPYISLHGIPCSLRQAGKAQLCWTLSSFGKPFRVKFLCVFCVVLIRF
jgi:hypothetical protein